MPNEKNEHLVGYARVSTNDQELRMQIDALVKAGVSRDNIHTDKLSGSSTDRPGLEECLADVGPGDTLIVWRLDRLGRSIRHLIDIVENLRQKQVGFKSLCDGSIDTTTASGEMIFNIFATLAQFERRLIQERTRAGLAAARARGRNGGRRRLGVTDPRIQAAKRMHGDKGMPIDDICSALKVSRSTLYRWISMATYGETR